MDHPSEVFLAMLEEDMMRLIIKHGQMVSYTILEKDLLLAKVNCLANLLENI